MRVLLDTHAFLWWVSGGGAKLSAAARSLIADPSTESLFSSASASEIATKFASGRIVMPARPERYIPDRLALHGFSVLPIGLEHALRTSLLPPIHRDPWDRILVAQAQVEGIPLVTADPAIAQYDVETIW